MRIDDVVAASIAERYGVLLEPATLGSAILQLQRTYAMGEDELLRELLLEPTRLRSLAGQLTIGESHFFRHPEQFCALSTWVAQRRAEGKSVSIWSAGCSRGEELYSVAMRLLLDHGPAIRHGVHLLGTDLDAAAIEVARQGLYSQWSLRGVAEAEHRRFFQSADGGMRLVEELRAWPQFDNLSIQERLEQWPSGSLAVLLFRNVGIYFTPDALAKVHRGFRRVLGDDGLLVQSATDPRPPASLFLGATMPLPVGLFVPRQSNQGSPRDTAPREGRRKSIPIQVKRRRSYRSTPSDCDNPRKALVQVSPIRHSSSDGDASGISVEYITTLADRGQIDEAERHLAAHLTLCPKSIEGLLLSGQFALHRGEPDRAVQALRSLLFLAPEHHLGRYWYVVALEHAGDSRAASEQRRELQRTLTSRSDRATPPSEELEEAIREMIRGAHGDKT